jgi:SAM-dependent methyltransferase
LQLRPAARSGPPGNATFCTVDNVDDVLAEQIAYYRARAGEYEDWWYRRGRYALLAADERDWFADVAEAEAALREFAPTGRVLELACGTGLWTRHLASQASQVTAVDAAPEVIALNRARLHGATNVSYVVADLFSWRPGPPAPALYDAVVFTYWLSHVPDDRLDGFWQMVRSALAPGGRVFLIDSAPYPPPPPRPSVATAPAGTASSRQGARTQSRTLDDGRTFTVVKRYWTPAELESDLQARGWLATAHTTEHGMILYATAVPDADQPAPPSDERGELRDTCLSAG